MSILLITPLFPPDVSKQALYAKTLLRHIAPNYPNQQITCLHYGQYPESVDGVKFISIKKDTSSVHRILNLTKYLFALRHHDKIIILNGPSVELPVLFIMPFLTTTRIYIKSDHDATQTSNLLYKWLQRFMSFGSHTITPQTDDLLPPIIHPLQHKTDNTKLFFNHWQSHLKEIETLWTQK